MSEDGVDRPQHQHLAAAATTLGIIFGVIGFIVAIITACVQSNNRSCITFSVVMNVGCLLVAILQLSAGGEWKKGSRSHLTPPGLAG